ncbi:MAG: hypothetical protein ACLQFR_18825 [Streptosporangiaceae bacterium]
MKPSLTPREYSFATPTDLGGQESYRRFCQAVGLEAIDGGWGFIHCTDQAGLHYTTVTSDVDYQRMLVEANNTPSLLAGLEISTEKYPRKRRGWPSEWGVS